MNLVLFTFMEVWAFSQGYHYLQVNGHETLYAVHNETAKIRCISKYALSHCGFEDPKGKKYTLLAGNTTLTVSGSLSRVTSRPVGATNGFKLWQNSLKFFKNSRRDDSGAKASGTTSPDNSTSSGSSSEKPRKWSLPSKISELFPKRKSKDQNSSKKYHRIRQDSDEFILDLDEAQNNKKKPEQKPYHQQQHDNQRRQSVDNQPGSSREPHQKTQVQPLQQPKLEEKHPQQTFQQSNKQYQQLKIPQPPKENQTKPCEQQNYQLPPQQQKNKQLQPQPQKKRPFQPQQQQIRPLQTQQQNRSLQPQQQNLQVQPQQQRRQLEPQQQNRQFQYQHHQQTEKRSLQPQQMQQKLTPPLPRQQPPKEQNYELFSRTSEWDEIRTPEGRVIQTFQGEPRPPQPRQKEPRLLPQPNYIRYPHRQLPDTNRLSQRELVTTNQVLYERATARQPSAPQLWSRSPRRHSIIETPRGPQKASKIQCQNIERLSHVSPRFLRRDNQLSLPNTPKKVVSIRENKSTQDIPLEIPQSDQRRPSQDYQLNQVQSIDAERETWQQPSVSNFSSPSTSRRYVTSPQCIPDLNQISQQGYSSSTHSVAPQNLIINYLLNSQCVVGASQISSQYYDKSSQNVAGPSQPLPQYYHASSMQSMSVPPQEPPQYHPTSSQCISGLDQGKSQYQAISAQIVSGVTQGEAQFYCPSSDYIQDQSLYYASPTPGTSGTTQDQQQYHASSTQNMPSTSQRQSQYQGQLTQKYVVPIQGQTQHTAQSSSGKNQNQSQQQTRSRQSASDSSQCSSHLAVSSSSQEPTKNINCTSQCTSGTFQSQTKKLTNTLQQTEPPSTGNSSQDVPKLKQNTSQDNPNISKGAIPKKILTPKNADTTKTKVQPTAGPSSSLDDPSEKSTDTSQSATTSSIKKSITSQKPTSSLAKNEVGHAKSAPSTSTTKASQNAPKQGPQPLLSTYSHLFSTLSKPNAFPLFSSFSQAQTSPTSNEPLNDAPNDATNDATNGATNDATKKTKKSSGPFAIFANTIPNATSMFIKMKNSLFGTNNEKLNSQLLEHNPIMNLFEVQKEVSHAGPGLVWRIHDAIRKSDSKECSVFIFDKRVVDKLYRPRTKELMMDRLKECIHELEKLNNPRMLHVIHKLEESIYTCAFATERIYSSLHNILTWMESRPINPEGPFPVFPNPPSLEPPTAQPMPTGGTKPPPFAREHEFTDFEIRHGFHQISEAILYMHKTMHIVHRNICPYNVLVTQRGVWKLFGLEFAEKIASDNPLDFLVVPQWSCKVSKICQPHLDYMPPETQMRGQCSSVTDMYGLGMTLSAVLNQGRSLMNTNFNPMLYVKQMEQLDRRVAALVNRLNADLQEIVARLLDRDPQNRPTTQMMSLMAYFKCANDESIKALDEFDMAITKNAQSRRAYYVEQLPKTLEIIPNKIRWQNVWTVLQVEFKNIDMIASVLTPVFWLVNECTQEELYKYIYPYIRKLIHTQKPFQITLVLIENIHLLAQKCHQDDIIHDLLPLVLHSLNSNVCQTQIAALIATENIHDDIPDDVLNEVVGKIKIILSKNTGDLKIINLVLSVFEKILPRIDRNIALAYVVPTLLNMQFKNAEVISRIVKLNKAIMKDEKIGLTCDVMATELIPSLAPQLINPTLQVDQFNYLIELLYDMLENIERYQRQRLQEEGTSVPASNQPLIREQRRMMNVPAPPFVIPNLKVQSKTSSDTMTQNNSAATISQPLSIAESVNAIRNRLGQWIFGSNNSTSNDGNFLRVNNIIPNRRLSDNTITTPKIRVAPSSASSPGGAPGTSGLPGRRHSSIGPQERRLSTAHLSPPTNARQQTGQSSGSSLFVPSTARVSGGSVPNTSSSVPFLSSALRRLSAQSQGGSQRGSQGSGILSHVVRLFPNTSATNSPRRTCNRWFQNNINSVNNLRRSTNILTRNFPSLNVTQNPFNKLF